ncbi:MAG TPA: DNA-binding transcriptional regulator [Cyclobacteriaceae bacterium]|nr:DNA-binding transcriptional regulator [Cyclobacteriaceae bacterium]
MAYKVILLTDFSEEYFKNLLRGITKYSKEYGPWIFCQMPSFYRETKGIEGILNWAKEWGANGIIGQFYNDSNVSKIMKAGIPVIAQDFKERFTDIPNISGDYFAAGKMGAEYFLRKGFKHFAFYGFKDIVWSRERGEGFENTLKEMGHEVHYFEHKKSRSRELWYYKPSSLSKWLKSLPKPIAIMTCDDNQGQHITQACRHSGIRIPEEVAVLGVDNDETICNLSDPPLSSISLDSEKGGYEAARLLHQMMKNKKKDFYDILVKPTQVITRHSTDIYATNDNYISSTLRYIHQNIDSNLKVDQILKQVPLSRRSLEKRFQEITGYPVYKYIYNLRVEKFAQRLLETDKTVFEIAIEIGLDDGKNISRSFKKVKGCTPQEYRQKYLIKKH